MNRESPEITITVVNNTMPLQDDDDTRWQTEDAPSFPGPLCVALPPKQPHRQASATPSMNSSDHSSSSCSEFNLKKKKTTCKSAAPRRPLRRQTLEIPHCPIRQVSEAPDNHNDDDNDDDDNNPLFLNRGESIASTIEEESTDEESAISLSLRFRDSVGIQEEGTSSRDLSPTRPVRQRSAPRGETSHASVSGFGAPAEETAEWVKLWQSQAPGNNSLSNLWEFGN